MDLWFFLVITASATDIVTRSKIAELFKRVVIPNSLIREGLSCAVCTGFWIGLVLGAVCFPIPWCWAYGLMGSLASNAYRAAIDWLDNRIHF